MKTRIPIFPLNLVMYPEALYPLHIFEERYKKLVTRCLDNTEGFGLVSKIDFDISDIGCYCTVYKILKRYEDGRYDILVRGEERIKIATTALHIDGYFEAKVIPFTDKVVIEEENQIYNAVKALFKGVLEKAEMKLESGFWSNLEKTGHKSFKFAEKSGLKIEQQQELLSLQSESERLDYLYKHLKKIEGILNKSLIFKDIIEGDGYINQLG